MPTLRNIKRSFVFDDPATQLQQPMRTGLRKSSSRAEHLNTSTHIGTSNTQTGEHAPFSNSFVVTKTEPLPPDEESKLLSNSPRHEIGHIPRPPNAFMIFRSELCAKNKSNGRVYEDQISLSESAGTLWNELDDSEKTLYRRKAHEAKSRHALQYPDYRYVPKLKKENVVKNNDGDARLRRRSTESGAKRKLGSSETLMDKGKTGMVASCARTKPLRRSRSGFKLPYPRPIPTNIIPAESGKHPVESSRSFNELPEANLTSPINEEHNCFSGSRTTPPSSPNADVHKAQFQNAIMFTHNDHDDVYQMRLDTSPGPEPIACHYFVDAPWVFPEHVYAEDDYCTYAALPANALAFSELSELVDSNEDPMDFRIQ